MSIYCTLPRSHRRQNCAFFTGHDGGSIATFTKPTIKNDPSCLFCEAPAPSPPLSTMDNYHHRSTLAMPMPMPTYYRRNQLPVLPLSNKVNLSLFPSPPSYQQLISSGISMNSLYNCHCPPMTADIANCNNFKLSFPVPTETSDTITFTESVTSTFDEYSSSTGTNNSNNNSKLYYATDSINDQTFNKQRKAPNFYGILNEEDGVHDDYELDEFDDVQSSNFDEYSGFRTSRFVDGSVDDITEQAHENYFTQLQQKHKHALCSLSSSSSSSKQYSNSTSSLNLSIHRLPFSRKRFGNLSARLSRFYKSKSNAPNHDSLIGSNGFVPLKFKFYSLRRKKVVNRNEKFNIKNNQTNEKSNTSESNYFCYDGQNSYKTGNKFRLSWRNNIFSDLWRPASKWHNQQRKQTEMANGKWCLDKNKNNTACTHDNNCGKSTKSATLLNHFERYFSFPRFGTMRERKKIVSNNNACLNATTVLNQREQPGECYEDKNNFRIKNVNHQSNSNSLINRNASFRSSISVASINKKRPLSMTYDIIRFSNQNNLSGDQNVAFKPEKVVITLHYFYLYYWCLDT